MIIVEIDTDFRKGRLYPGDLKSSLIQAINAVLEPVREHFATNERAQQLANRVRCFTITR